MKGKTISINGKEFVMLEEVSCFEQDQESLMETVAMMTDDDFVKRNLATDLYFYDGEKKEICFAKIANSPKMQQAIPDVPLKELRIGGYKDARVIYVNEEASERDVSSLTYQIETKAIKDILENVVSGLGLGKAVSYDSKKALDDVLKALSLQYQTVLTSYVMAGEDGKVKLEIVEIPVVEENIKIEILNIGSTKEDRDAAMGAIEKVMANPGLASKLYFEKDLLPIFLAGVEEAIALPFSLKIVSARVQDGKLVYSFAIQEDMQEMSLGVSDRFLKHLASLPEEKREDEKLLVNNILKFVSGARNTADAYNRMLTIQMKYLEAWKEGLPSFIVKFDKQVNANGEVSFVLDKTPMPKEIKLEGDFPEDERAVLEKMFSTAVSDGFVDLMKFEESSVKAKKYLQDKGYDIMNFKPLMGYDGILRLSVELRRWELAYTVIVSEDESSAERKEEVSKIMSDIVAELEGKFMTAEDKAAVKRKLGRAVGRNYVEEVVFTEPNTKKSAVIFVASENPSKFELPLAFGGGSQGMVLNVGFRMPDNGRGTSFNASIFGLFDSSAFGKFFKTFAWPFGVNPDWQVDDVEMVSVNLGMSHTISANERMGYEVYGSKKQYDGLKQGVIGAGTTYTRYAMNDKIAFNIGGNLEYVDVPSGTAGYNNAAYRVSPSAGVCYKDKRLSACLSGFATAGATTYGQLQGRASYTIPLSSDTYIRTSVAGAVQGGNVPLLEQLRDTSLPLPFQYTIGGGSYSVGKYAIGASVELIHALGGMWALKPLVATAKAIGSKASLSVGSCISYGPFDICAVYTNGLNHSQKGLGIAIGLSEGFEVPEWLRTVAEYILGNRLE